MGGIFSIVDFLMFLLDIVFPICFQLCFFLGVL